MSGSDGFGASGGGGEPITEAEALRRLRLTDDPSAQYYAAWWLGRNRSRHPDAVPLLQEALRQRRPRDPGAGVEENAVARNAARALGKLGAPATAAIPDLLATLDDDDHGLREAAARALGDLRAEAAVQALCRRLASGPSVAGAMQPGTPRLQEPCEALLEALGEIGVAEAEVLAVIRPFVEHERPLIRSAACRALLQLTSEPHLGPAAGGLAPTPAAAGAPGGLDGSWRRRLEAGAPADCGHPRRKQPQADRPARPGGKHR